MNTKTKKQTIQNRGLVNIFFLRDMVVNNNGLSYPFKKYQFQYSEIFIFSNCNIHIVLIWYVLYGNITPKNMTIKYSFIRVSAQGIKIWTHILIFIFLTFLMQQIMYCNIVLYIVHILYTFSYYFVYNHLIPLNAHRMYHVLYYFPSILSPELLK